MDYTYLLYAGVVFLLLPFVYSLRPIFRQSPVSLSPRASKP